MCVYRIWNFPICSRHAAEVFPLPRFLPNPKLEKKKKIYTRLSKQYGFASQGFLVVRGNGWGLLWSGRHTRR